jgi:hypothetical protein
VSPGVKETILMPRPGYAAGLGQRKLPGRFTGALHLTAAVPLHVRP